MDLSKVAIAAISWARNPVEAQMIEEGLRHLSSLGIPVVVVDGGSPEDFVRRLRAIEGTSVFEPRADTLQDHVAQGLEEAAATGREFLLYTEGDKRWFFQHKLAEFLRSTPDGERVGTVFPARTPESFATFPQFQQYVETVINSMTGEMIERTGDFSYGPRLVRASLVPFLKALRRDLGWGWQSYLAVISHRLGQEVLDIPLDLPCPDEQRNEAGQQARLFRLTQLSQHMDGLVQGFKVAL